MSYHDGCKSVFPEEAVIALRVEAESRLARVSAPQERIEIALRLAATFVEAAAYDLARSPQSAMTAKLILTAADLDRTADLLQKEDRG